MHCRGRTVDLWTLWLAAARCLQDLASLSVMVNLRMINWLASAAALLYMGRTLIRFRIPFLELPVISITDRWKRSSDPRESCTKTQPRSSGEESDQWSVFHTPQTMWQKMPHNITASGQLLLHHCPRLHPNCQRASGSEVLTTHGSRAPLCLRLSDNCFRNKLVLPRWKQMTNNDFLKSVSSA